MSSSRDAKHVDEPKADLAPPDIIGVLDPVPGGEENLLRKDAWLVPLRIEFELWSDSAPESDKADTLQLFWKGEKIDEKVLPGPVQAADLWLNVPSLKLEEGVHALHYEVIPWNTPTPRECVPVNVTIDKTPPILAADNKLVFPSEVLPPNKLTAHYLELNGDEVKADLPGYTTPRPWDRITWYWGSSPGDLNRGGIIELDDNNYADPVVLTVPSQFIQDRGNGLRYVSYRVQDRAGNWSQYSLAVELDVDATPIPRVLPWPRVENASGTGEQQTLGPLNFLSGAVVEIPDTAVIYPGEKVWVQWSDPGSVGEYRTDREISAGSRRYQIPMSSIAAYIGKTLPLSYSVIDHKDDELPSVKRRLNIQTVSSSEFPIVQCQGLSGGDLSLRNVPETGAVLTLAKWVLMTTDQWIMINMTGTGASGAVEFSAVRRRQVTEQEVSYGVGQRGDVTVSRTFLSSLRRPGPLTGKVYVSFDGGVTWPPLAVPNFPILNLRLVD
ncbi:hypothetical protein [Pseudomonas sp. G2-4]|uniref:hypothetical protein n=1 Tax=Pseudomonas sp. G2-4 TaxID=1506334 RepID=UPI0024B90429|nr:hypothetical protein [Pseudomonas sp. G2-4]WHS58967.1 hypothetical protein QNH97_21300 [Pseudomonas sp. G2-4]